MENELKYLSIAVFALALASCKKSNISHDNYTIEQLQGKLLVEREDGSFSVAINSNASNAYVEIIVDELPIVKATYKIQDGEIEDVTLLEDKSSESLRYRIIGPSGKVLHTYEISSPYPPDQESSHGRKK